VFSVLLSIESQAQKPITAEKLSDDTKPKTTENPSDDTKPKTTEKPSDDTKPKTTETPSDGTNPKTTDKTSDGTKPTERTKSKPAEESKDGTKTSEYYYIEKSKQRLLSPNSLAGYFPISPMEEIPVIHLVSTCNLTAYMYIVYQQTLRQHTLTCYRL
jgi:hypothetical protein